VVLSFIHTCVVDAVLWVMISKRERQLVTNTAIQYEKIV